MSASSRLKFGVGAAGLTCLLLSYAIAQEVQTPSRESAAGQTGSAATQQTDRSATPSSERTYGSATQQRTANYRGAQNAAGQSQAVDHFLAGCLLSHNQAEVQLSELAQ